MLLFPEREIDVNATFDTDFVVAPNLVIEGNAGGELTLLLAYMNNETSLNIGLTIPTPAAIGVDLSSNSDCFCVWYRLYFLCACLGYL